MGREIERPPERNSVMRFIQRLFTIIVLTVIAIVTLPVSARPVSVTVAVPAGTVSVDQFVAGVNNSTGAVTSVSGSTFNQSSGTITINLPDNTATTTYGGGANFYDGSGNLISTFTVQNDTSPGDGKSEPSH